MGGNGRETMFPVRTGMNRDINTPRDLNMNVPRTHGDEPNVIAETDGVNKCSPYARG